MERLTKWEDDSITYNEKREFECGEYCDSCSQGAGNCKTVENMIKKLATYEDLEEQGLLVRLPCKLKDKLYHFYGIDLEDNFADVISDEIIMEVVATEFIIDSYETAIKCITDWNSPYEYLPVVEFGKTVFLNREDAERKLKELENE
jgi:hypothetical protein|nr:MAG TPA: hypothetical protein [Caudoviricetes sp.]